MNSPKLTTLLLAGSLLLATGCQKDLLDKTNPNAPSTAQFWKSSDDAVKGVYACYSGLQQYAVYGHSWQFMAARSDESYSQSPFVELANFTRFITPDNNFFISSFAWNDYYRTIYRTNQVLAHVPDITMDATLKSRLLAETRFIRAISYFDLAYFFGRIPLILIEPGPTTRAPQGTQDQAIAQVITDLQAAIPDLPLSYSGTDKGRATKGAAQALLARVYMHQRKYAEASALFTTIVGSNQYSLVSSYLDNFTESNENNSESLFEIQYTGTPLDVGQGQDNASASEAYDRPNFFGPPGATFADVQPRQWVNLASLTGTYSQDAMRQLIRAERAREFAGEGIRWYDILRWGLMDDQAGIDALKARDTDFTNFRLGISKLLPIPQRDIDIDPGVTQNPGY